ncbi:MAG: sigma-70 family RNA polymerase sigma factor, partial [Candidatus Nanopelagicales bacterium]
GLRLAVVHPTSPNRSTVETAGSLGEVAVGRDAREAAMHPELESVFRAEYLYVVAVARRILHSTAEAEDVAQEVFVSFARSIVPAAEARPWLSVAAAHTALNVLRAQQRRLTRENLAIDTRHSPDAADEAMAMAERQRVRDALARLPRQQAVVLVLRHSGLSYADVADATHLSPSSVGTTLRRAEAALRKELSDESSV